MIASLDLARHSANEHQETRHRPKLCGERIVKRLQSWYFRGRSRVFDTPERSSANRQYCDWNFRYGVNLVSGES